MERNSISLYGKKGTFSKKVRLVKKNPQNSALYEKYRFLMI